MKLILRGLTLTIGFICIWQLIVNIFNLPTYILPTPIEVFKVWYKHMDLIANETLSTIIETLLGLIIGTLLGCCTALIMAFFNPARKWILPILIISQAVPTFAMAPLLVIWFGFGMASKIAVTIIMIFFPITSAFFDGLRRTHPSWLDLAKTMQAKKSLIFWHIRIPAALPSLASGLRIATVIAPVGAVIGEWVGASQGLGYLMLNANARMEIDLMFAALFTIVIFSLILYFIVDKFLKYTISWHLES